MAVSPFNRTTLELKLYGVAICTVGEATFNRTTLELKREKAKLRDEFNNSFNRTTLELKQGYDEPKQMQGCNF